MHEFSGIKVNPLSVVLMDYTSAMRELSTADGVERQESTNEDTFENLKARVIKEGENTGQNPESYQIAMTAITIRILALKDPQSAIFAEDVDCDTLETFFAALPVPDVATTFEDPKLGEDFNKVLPLMIFVREIERHNLTNEQQIRLPNSLASLVPERFWNFFGVPQPFINALNKRTFIQDCIMLGYRNNYVFHPHDVNRILDVTAFINGSSRAQVDSDMMHKIDNLNFGIPGWLERADVFRQVLQGMLDRPIKAEIPAIQNGSMDKLFYFIRDTFNLDLNGPLLDGFTPEEAVAYRMFNQMTYFDKYIAIFIPRDYPNTRDAKRLLRDEFYKVCGRVINPQRVQW